MARSVLGSGSDTTQFMMHDLDGLYQFSPGCSQIPNPAGPTAWLDFSCQAPDPANTVTTENYRHDQLTEATFLGSSNGISQLCKQGQAGVAHIDFARSSRGPKATDCGGLHFTAYARDGISVEAFDSSATAGIHNIQNGHGACSGTAAGTFCLTQGDLQGIFETCSITNWNQVGGQNQAISIYTAQPGSGTRSTFDGFLGGIKDSSHCIPQNQLGTHQIPENANSAALLADSAGAIFPFSFGVWSTTVNGANSSKLAAVDNVAATASTIADGSFPYGRFLYNVTCVACSGPESSAAAISYVGEEGWLCKNSDGHGNDPATGVNYRTEIENKITASGFVPIPTGVIGGTDQNQDHCRLFTTQAVAPPTVPVAVFPAMSNGAYGGYVTAATIQNAGSSAASIHIAYFDQSGAAVGAGDVNAALAPNASMTVRQDNGNSFATGTAGSAIVYSTQPIASFVNEFAPGNAGDATSYTGIPVPSGVGPYLYAPTIANNAFGGYTTGIGLINEGSSPANVTITYTDASGNVVKTQTVSSLAANAYQAFYSGDPALGLPNGFSGTATITGSAGAQLGAVVNETGPGGQFSSYDAVSAGATSLDAPVALKNAFGGFNTGLGIQNTSAIAGNVAVAYYDSMGNPAGTPKTFPISANGSLSIYQGGSDGPPNPGAYTAVISSALPLAAIVNEVAPPGPGSAQLSTAYNTFAAGSGSLHLPLVENAGTDPWNTGEGIMNTGSASTTVTVTYYNAGTGAPIGTPVVATLAPQASLSLSQPDPNSGLPAGSKATAVVTTPSGGQVAVITNERGPTTFMSYDGQ